MRKQLRRVATVSALICVLYFPSLARADPESQYQAFMTQYFFHKHSAIPLFSNGSVKSGQIIRLPDEMPFRPGSACFPGVVFKPLNLPNKELGSEVSLSLQLGGAIPARKIAQIKAVVGGIYGDSSHFIFEPFSQDSQPDGLGKFQNMSKSCADELKNSFDSGQFFIIAAKVFRARVWGKVDVDLSGELDANAELRMQDELQKLLGDKVKVSFTGNGRLATLGVTRFPDVQSIAVVSAYLDKGTLGRIFFKLRDNVDGRELENLVEQYVYGREPGVLLELSANIENTLRDADLFYNDMVDLYRSVFGGPESEPLDDGRLDEIPQEQWDALGLVAAANLISQR